MKNQVASPDKTSQKQNGKPANSNARAAAESRPAANPRLFTTPEANAIKKEICDVGRKLWLRQFVDGNGGNVSYRIGPNEVICTPTMMSKFDMTPEDLSLVDLEGNQIAGTEPSTSEIYLHLEIYKEVPQAKAVVHCHAPHATAYAITGKVPPNKIIPEYEIFVGKVAIAPYQTPGTVEFARSVTPFVKQHNAVLLTNHGLVCWADTVTHAEWYAETLDIYCWTLMLAAQMGVPLSYIPDDKVANLLERKKLYGLPDIRFDKSRPKECQQADLETPDSIALTPTPCEGSPAISAAANSGANVAAKGGADVEASGRADFAALSGAQLEALVQQITKSVLEALASESALKK